MDFRSLLRNGRYPVLLSLIVLAAFSPLIWAETHYKAGEVTSDFPAIMEFAQNIESGAAAVPGFAVAHSAWELLVLALHMLAGISIRTSAWLATTSSILAAALILYYWLAPTLRSRSLSPWLAVAAAVGLNLVTPISILATRDREYYLGYIGIASYHNPTILLLRPLALVQFIAALRCFGSSRASWKWIALGCASSLLATFAKPSLAICLLPAMGLLIAYRMAKRLAVDLRFFILGFAIPTLLVLAGQFLVTYGSLSTSGIFFFPFGVMQALSGYLGLKFVLSIIFPLLVACLFFPQVIRDERMLLAWLTFVLGAFYAYFLADGPPRTFDGNFIWSAEIALLVLFCTSTVFLFEQFQRFRARSGIVAVAWLTHMAFGVVYYFHVFVTRKYI